MSEENIDNLAWPVQAACEAMGYEGIWDVPEDMLDAVLRVADDFEELG